MNYIKTPESFRLKGESTHGKGRHKAHRVGDSISFAVPNGRKSGTVTAVHKEFYLVTSNGVTHKVNRNSILYSMGQFVGAAKRFVGSRKEIEKGIKAGEKTSLRESAKNKAKGLYELSQTKAGKSAYKSVKKLAKSAIKTTKRTVRDAPSFATMEREHSKRPHSRGALSFEMMREDYRKSKKGKKNA